MQTGIIGPKIISRKAKTRKLASKSGAKAEKSYY